MLKYKTTISFTLIISLFMLTTCPSVLAAADAVELTRVQKAETLLFEEKIEKTATSIDIELETVKILKDFSGNTYTLVECEPSGYYIYHNESGNFVEYSMEAPSPYAGFFGDHLYYGGPTEYYFLKGSEFYHTILENDTFSESIAPLLVESCDEMVDFLMADADNDVLNFIDEVKTGEITVQQAQNHISNIIPAAATEKLITSSTHISKLKTKTQIGYFTEGNGACGYIAGGIMLYYWQQRSGGYIKTSSWYNSSGLTGTGLTKNLRSIGKDLGFGPDTVPWQMRDVLNKYCKNNSVKATAGYWLLNTNISSELNNNRPSIMFGNLYNPQGGKTNHAVVVYGHGLEKPSDDSSVYIAHYGWENYNKVYVRNGTVGGSTNLKPS